MDNRRARTHINPLSCMHKSRNAAAAAAARPPTAKKLSSIFTISLCYAHESVPARDTFPFSKLVSFFFFLLTYISMYIYI